MSIGSLSRPAEGGSHEAGDGYLLRSEADLAKAVTYAIEQSVALGAGGAIARVSEGGGISITVANGEVENAVRDGNQSLQITVFLEGRTGMASTESLSRDAVDRVVEQAISMARQLEPDEEAGLADREALAWDSPSVPLFAPSFHTAVELTNAAMAIEAAVMATSTADTVRVSEAGAASQDARFALATSQGFCRAGSSSMQHRWCQTIAQRGDEMKQGNWSSGVRRIEELESAEQIGRLAAERALDMLGAEGLTTRRAPVLIDSTVASSLVRDMCGQLSGGAQFQRMTFLPDAMGQVLAASHLSVTEDPFEPFGLASAAFDSEGVAGACRDIIRDGVVKGLFLDTRMGRKLGRASTGNAGGMRNLTLVSNLTSSTDDLAAMLRKMGTGLWLTRFMGGGSDPATGVYSSAAAGFWVENGQVMQAVQGFTVAGNLQEMFKAIVAVGADIYRDGAIRTGSILLPDMQIAGR
ncbi:pmbA protein [Nitrospirillum viridazoti Y2]|uniref:Microcin-processing peptidase 1 n=1 Tax=Nitrospirillum amazonense TaxID=28077 RepID=A0A560J5C1_9PROT|nr:metallopeptidase TldD-related protein [Nitrospirillum amazonense]EGY01977.1 pmbA protein [Nitrospirillum amazonense Y2]TWB64434.1 microcin-processing peptidase 1 [Nitrospirillum amazonense]